MTLAKAKIRENTDDGRQKFCPLSSALGSPKGVQPTGTECKWEKCDKHKTRNFLTVFLFISETSMLKKLKSLFAVKRVLCLSTRYAGYVKCASFCITCILF